MSVLGGDRGELPVVVDVEHDRRKDGSEVPPPPFSVLEPGLRACLTRITQLMGRKPIIYTRASYWNQFLGALPWTQDYDLWVANWVAHWTPTSRPRLPRGWATYRFWQYSGDGNGQGASLGVSSPDIDLNLFNGDLNALRDYAAGHPIVMPPERTMWVIAVSGLNFRSRPIVSAATLIAKLPFATQLTAIGKETSDAQGNKWQRVRLLDGRIGFVCAFLASIGQRFLAAQPPATAVQLIVTKPGAALRDRPVNGSLLARLKLHDALMLTDVSDASVMHIGTRGQWLAVTDAQGRVGYVSAQNVELAPKPK